MERKIPLFPNGPPPVAAATTGSGRGGQNVEQQWKWNGIGYGRGRGTNSGDKGRGGHFEKRRGGRNASSQKSAQSINPGSSSSQHHYHHRRGYSGQLNLHGRKHGGSVRSYFEGQPIQYAPRAPATSPPLQNAAPRHSPAQTQGVASGHVMPPPQHFNFSGGLFYPLQIPPPPTLPAPPYPGINNWPIFQGPSLPRVSHPVYFPPPALP